MDKPELHVNSILEGVIHLIEDARQKVALYVNAETTLLYWGIGSFLNNVLSCDGVARIDATLARNGFCDCAGNFNYF